VDVEEELVSGRAGVQVANDATKRYLGWLAKITSSEKRSVNEMCNGVGVMYLMFLIDVCVKPIVNL